MSNPALHYSDVRLALYGLTGMALVTGLLSTRMTKTCLLQLTWWNANAPQIASTVDRQKQTDEFVTHNKISVFVLFFSFYEATIRGS